MKKILTCSLLLVSLSAVAQSTVYQAFDVDSAAQPMGGQSYLSLFLEANLQKPIWIQAQGIGGRVTLTGIVEPDGKLSNPKILQGFQADCDQEALRVFRLYNAWKPAQKKGQVVRQQITLPILFAKNEPFYYVNGAQITYFGSEREIVSDSTQALYKQIAPLDSMGLPAGDIVVYRLRKTSWKEYSRLPLVRKPHAYKKNDGQYINILGYQNENMRWEGQCIEIDEDGDLFRNTFYKNGKRVGTERTYHSNGIVQQKSDDDEDRFLNKSWYPNGQIQQVRINYKPTLGRPFNNELVEGVWEKDGRQLVKKGNGYATYQTDIKSESDPTRKTIFTEKGAYENGLKQGIWQGSYADKSYFYEEQYDKGVCLSGKMRINEADTVRYTDVEKTPEFDGGMQGLSQFLEQNLQYPADAQRSRVTGKVAVSFVVCEDGSLCDYEVIKSVHPELDAEAVRVVKKMSGRWKPGSQRGRKVRVKYNLPINFSLH